MAQVATITGVTVVVCISFVPRLHPTDVFTASKVEKLEHPLLAVIISDAISLKALPLGSHYPKLSHTIWTRYPKR
jgi:hypothetical protein